MANEQSEFKFPDETQVVDPNEDKSKVEIEVVDDTPPEDQGRTPMAEPPDEPTEEELNQYSESAKKRIQHFTKGYHEERRAKETAFREKEEALRYAQQLIDENKRLQGTLNQGQTVIVDQAKTAATAELEAAKRAFRDAHEKGDTDKLVEAQEAITSAKIKLDRLNSFRPAPSQPQGTEVQSNQQVPQTTQTNVDPKANAWRTKNRWFGTNDEMTALALVTHQKLIRQGMDPNSDSYYQAIEKRVREKFPEEFSDMSPNDASSSNGGNREARETKPATVVAPATRSTAPNKIVLTKSQVSIAKRLNVPLEAYAKQVALEKRKQNG